MKSATLKIFLVALGLSVMNFSCKSDEAGGSAATQTPNAPAASASPTQGQPQRLPVLTYEVVNTFPHDPNSFTQGLVYRDGSLYESAGEYGKSSLRKVELQTGRVVQQTAVPPKYFAEGLALLNGKLYQLTWQEHTGFVYDAGTFQKLDEFYVDGDGWGLTTDGESLILSDGTNQIRFLDPATFRVRRTISVLFNNRPLTELNELEYVKGEIYANVWHTDRIARIDPKSGALLGWVDLSGLLPAAERSSREAVLNGIAYDESGGRLFVTGKLWPKLFEIKLKPRE
jgi:glutamine cyclotransferase